MINIGGQPYSCTDCSFQHLDWEQMRRHVRKAHQREPYCGPDRLITPNNIEVGRILVNNQTMQRVRITKIIDRAQLKVEVESLPFDNATLLSYDTERREWQFT